MTISAKDTQEFNSYLRQCTNAQVEGVLEKEREAGRAEYVNLAKSEMERRGMAASTNKPRVA